MPIDSKKKRKGATAPPRPATTVPFPDGVISAADRGVLSGVYVPANMAADERRGFLMYGDEDCFTLKRKRA